jgi:thiol-disulfide isomerase/thioredoxin
MLGFCKQGLKFVVLLSLRTAAISLIGILLLTACQSKTPAPKTTEITKTVESNPAANPLLTVQTSGNITATPNPVLTQSADGAYPGPQSYLLPTSIGSYPLPGSGAIQTQGGPDPYPDPANNASNISPTPDGQSGTGFTNPYPSPAVSPYPGPSTNPTTQPPATTQPVATVQPNSTSIPFPTESPTSNVGPSSTATAIITAGPTATTQPTPTPTPGATPTVSLQTDLLATDPSTVKLAAGKPQLIVFFAYWDGNSRIMMPALLSLQDEFVTEVNFIFLDIDDPATAQLKRVLYFNYYDVLPQYFFLGPEGKILRKWRGVTQQSDLQQMIEGP